MCSVVGYSTVGVGIRLPFSVVGYCTVGVTIGTAFQQCWVQHYRGCVSVICSVVGYCAVGVTVCTRTHIRVRTEGREVMSRGSVVL